MDSYKVKVWEIEKRVNRAGVVTSYRVRWMVEQERFVESFKKSASATGFRSLLIAAQGRGEAFSAESGRPRSMERPVERVELSWYALTQSYVDMKWPDQAATARQTIAEALIRVMPVFVVPGVQDGPSAQVVRSVLRQWGYNTTARSEQVPVNVQRVLDWCEQNTEPVRVVLEPDRLRRLQRAVTRRLDGGAFAPSVARKTRAVLSNVLDYAVELKQFDANPLPGVKWTAMPKGKRKVSRRSVSNPVQSRTLLLGVRAVLRSGPRLEAFFGAMYYAALRPEEVAALVLADLELPEPVWNGGRPTFGWGMIHLGEAHPHAGARWTDSGRPRDVRHLKSRSAGESRSVPCPPALTELFWVHLRAFGTGAGGLLFVGERGGQVPMITYTRVWRSTRKAVLTEQAHRSPLAARPYDLRHAAVSTWLEAGVSPARVAEWAGHSVAVLYEVYAAFLDGGEAAARKQVDAALGHGSAG